MVVVGGIWLRDGDYSNGTNETSDVIHVAVGIVPGDAAIHPQNLVDAEIVVKDPLQIFAAEARVALLHLLSRHSSVVIRVPWPLTSILPPSSTTRWAAGPGIPASSWGGAAVPPLSRESGRQAASPCTSPRR